MRDSTVDIAKGIGIFLVVLGHFTVFASPLYHYIYLFHMPLFFFIGGMFVKDTNVMDCFTKKAKRLLVPYLFYWIFYRIIQYWGQIIFLHDFSLETINFDISTGGVLWFLISLWCVHIIYAIGRGMPLKLAYIFYGVISILGIVLGYNNIRLPFYLSQTMLMLPFFLLGNIFNHNHTFNGKTAYEYISSSGIISWPFLITIIIYFIPCGFMDVNGPVIPNVWQFIITPLSGIIMIFMISRQFSIFWKKLKMDKLGKNSLQILGIHAPFIPLVWLISIPIIMRSLSFINLSVSGEQIKEFIWIQLLLSILLTIISHKLGLLLIRTFPSILK